MPSGPLRLARVALAATLALAASACTAAPPHAETPMTHDDLVTLFEEWRAFEEPPLRDGAPDYTADRMAAAHAELATYVDRLHAFDIDDWPVEEQIDWHVVRAELNGFDFRCRVLKPWERDPAFYLTVWTYRSDVPAHEGPTHHGLVELWTYDFPLSASEEARLAEELAVIPPLLEQARGNLTGDAAELFSAGIATIEEQRETLDDLHERVADGAGPELTSALVAAREATASFIAWLEAEAPKKTGPSGIGKDDYTWHLQNVMLVPFTWEDEVRLLQRELDRAWSNLKLEETRNAGLPELVAASNAAEYDAQADEGVRRLMAFLRDRKIMPVKDNMEPALREHLGSYVPEETRNFFWITAHYDPVPLYTHFYHWWDLAQMRDEPHPSPIRRDALLYNIFVSRAEGTATGVEEMFLHAGLYDDSPRSREIVWILLAQRAARGLGSLYAHANEMTMEEAGGVHVEWTPRGWMSTEPELLRFEQHLYLRQPFYGTSYVTGKSMLEQLVAKYAKQREARGEPFVSSAFFEAFNDAGMIPMSLIHWQLTGDDSRVPPATEAP